MKFKKTTLKNGLRIVTVPMPDNPSVTVLVMVQAGSKYETKEVSGLSHFLEHMVFKGTPSRPKASDISRELDSIGAHYNAFTTQEFTGYYAKAAPKNLSRILDIVSDMYQNPLFEQSEIDKERGVIIEEIRMYQDLPQRQVQESLNELMHGDQPAGWSVLGTEEILKKLNRDNFLEYRKQHYVASATTIVVAGDIDSGAVVKKVSKAFAKIPAEPKTAKVAVIEKQSAPAIRTIFKETDQTHLALAVRTFSIFDKRTPALIILASLLGGSMSSRLFTRLRDELGMCYYVRASANSLTDHGDLTITAGVDNSRVEEAIREILAQCRKLKDELVKLDELRKVKDYLAGTTVLELETSDSRAEYCGFQETVKGQIELPKALLAKLNKVTAAEIKKLAQTIFTDEKLNMAIIGRYKDAETFRPYFKLS